MKNIFWIKKFSKINLLLQVDNIYQPAIAVYQRLKARIIFHKYKYYLDNIMKIKESMKLFL